MAPCLEMDDSDLELAMPRFLCIANCMSDPLPDVVTDDPAPPKPAPAAAPEAAPLTTPDQDACMAPCLEMDEADPELATPRFLCIANCMSVPLPDGMAKAAKVAKAGAPVPVHHHTWAHTLMTLLALDRAAMKTLRAA